MCVFPAIMFPALKWAIAGQIDLAAPKPVKLLLRVYRLVLVGDIPLSRIVSLTIFPIIYVREEVSLYETTRAYIFRAGGGTYLRTV